MSEARREAGGARPGRRSLGEGGFDAAIEGAVREMLDVEPPANLRARVVAEIAASGSRLPASRFRLPASGWVLGSLAAAVLIVLAVFIARRSEPLPQAPAVAAAVDRYLPAEGPVTPAEEPATPAAAPAPREMGPRTTVAHATKPSTGVEASVTVFAASVAENATTEIRPLRTLGTIEIAPIGQRSIAPDPLTLTPLTPIAEMQIAPITSPGRRH